MQHWLEASKIGQQLVKLAGGFLINKNSPIQICNRHEFCHLTFKNITKNYKSLF